MHRRSFVSSSTAAALMTTANAQSPKPAILELRYFRLRNTADNQRARLADFLAKSAVPALTRAGAGPVGLFASSIAPDTPFLLMVVQHASLAAYEQTTDKLAQDQAYTAAHAALTQNPAIPYERMEVQLLRGFPSFPAVEVPKTESGRAPRLFELRTYESNTPTSLAKKIGMFDNGEIAIFRQYGLLPVFFGEMVAGPRMPNLTYMVAFDNLAAREANWKAFASSPEWAKLRATPGLADAEIVSNISNIILSPINGSQIR